MKIGTIGALRAQPLIFQTKDIKPSATNSQKSATANPTAQNWQAYSAITFGKDLVSTATVKNAYNEKETVNFVRYDSYNNSDAEHLEEVANEWGTAYSDYIASSFTDPLDDENRVYYGIETEEGETLALMQALEVKNRNLKDGYYLEIEFLRTNPRYDYTGDEREYSHCGEAIVSAAVKEADKNGLDAIGLCSTNDNFWNSSGLFKNTDAYLREATAGLTRFLYREDFDKYVDFVKNKVDEQ